MLPKDARRSSIFPVEVFVEQAVAVLSGHTHIHRGLVVSENSNVLWRHYLHVGLDFFVVFTL